jgi:hypothetical protein
MENRSLSLISALLLGLLIGAGAAAGGFFVGDGFYRARAERYVTVKGLVERNVTADLGLWNISYTAAGPDLNSVNNELERDQKAVVAFAHSHGFADSDVRVQPTTVTDNFANAIENNRPDPNHRFVIKGGVRIRSARVGQIQQASEATGDLVKQGVALGENYPQAPQYFFTRLNDIRPSMLAQATMSARAVANQFAADSHSRLGPIRRANQGVFEIMGRDAAGDRAPGSDQEAQESIEKKVRLVSTVDYYLLD